MCVRVVFVRLYAAALCNYQRLSFMEEFGGGEVACKLDMIEGFAAETAATRVLFAEDMRE